VSTLTTPEHVVDDQDVDPFIAHLYRAGSRYSLCGLCDDHDPHSVMHHQNSASTPSFFKSDGPGDCCPSCGAPICEMCRERVTATSKEKETK
jgi:hypothetical protein